MTATGAEGTSFERMDHYMDGVIDLVRNTVPEADGVLANTSGFAGAANAGNCTVTLVPREDRKRTQQQIADQLVRTRQSSRAEGHVVAGDAQPLSDAVRCAHCRLMGEARALRSPRGTGCVRKMSNGIFVRGIDRPKVEEFRAHRQYEQLEMLILNALMGRKE